MLCATVMYRYRVALSATNIVRFLHCGLSLARTMYPGKQGRIMVPADPEA